MISRAIFLVLAIGFGLLSLGGVSYGLKPASAGDSMARYFTMLITTIALTVVFSWLAFRTRPSAGPTTPKGPTQQLQELQALQDQGFITPEEFEAKRAQIVAQL